MSDIIIIRPAYTGRVTAAYVYVAPCKKATGATKPINEDQSRVAWVGKISRSMITGLVNNNMLRHF